MGMEPNGSVGGRGRVAIHSVPPLGPRIVRKDRIRPAASETSVSLVTSYCCRKYFVAAPIPSRSKKTQPEVLCATCGHAELEHGRTGTRPCLASVGELADLGFCRCDEFRPKAQRAA